MPSSYCSILKKVFFSIAIYISSILFSFAQECGVIYITPSGATSGAAGTRANPASLDHGLTLFSLSAKRLWLSTGTYIISSTIALPDSIIIEGGFNATTWSKSNVAASIINRNTSNYLVANNALIGIGALNATAFRLQDLTITVDNAPGNGVSVYGIYLNGCKNYNITRCTITTGSASPGLTGSPGTAGSNGNNGNAGLAGKLGGPAIPGGLGGTGVNPGGAGADVTDYENVNAGLTGTGPSPGTGGAGGTGPSCSAGCVFGSPSCSSTTPGQPGQSGGSGLSGTIGSAGVAGSIVTGYYVPGAGGGNGTNGNDGSGGGGGGGGGGRQLNGTDSWGGSGGGGGAGGGGGGGGTGGTGGGGSFAVFLYNNSTGGIIQDCLLNPGAGGAGGTGGAGGAGGFGGTGGVGGAAGQCSNGVGGNGGNGGSGGSGGSGGTGLPGISVALSENGGTPITNLGITSVPGNPPVISVNNRGCTKGEVLFTSTTSGTWNFGTGATPATANGTGPIAVIYTTLGRKTITQSGTSFTDYIDIFSTGPGGSTITPANAAVTLGCPNSFTTSLAGTYYQWLLGSAANPDTVQGATMQSISNIIYGAAGTYKVKVWVTTACCGRVQDSTSITINPNTNNVTLTVSPPSICVGDNITFTISETYSGYSFIINGTTVQTGPGKSYSTTTLQPGDSIVAIGFAGTCFTNPSTTLYPVVTPKPVVALTSSSTGNSICAGQSVTFTASPTGYTNYQFLNGSTSVQTGPSNIYTTTTLIPGNSITVIATNLGCPSSPSSAIVTTVNPLPGPITITGSAVNNTICPGDNVTITANPGGNATYNFSVNGSSVQSGASNIYSTTTLANGNTVNAIATTSAGCVSTVSNTLTFTVNPIPTVTLTSSDDSICPGGSVLFTASAGNDNYQFFNGATSIQNGSSNSFTSSTLISGNSLTVIATKSGCSSPTSNAISIYIFPVPSVTLVSSDADNTICAGDNVVFTASPAGLMKYEFFKNSISVQSGSGNSYSTSGLINGDAITVVGTNFGCPSVLSNSIATTVNPIPAASVITGSAANNTICPGDNVTITASPGGNAIYDFSVNGVSVQSGASTTYSTSALTNGNTVNVVTTSAAGCKSPVSNILTFTVNPKPSVTLTASDDSICPGGSVLFLASGGNNNYQFFNGSTSVQNGPGNTFTSTSLVTGNSLTVVATKSGCSSPPSNAISIYVFPSPSVTLTSSDADNTICTGENVVFTASPSGLIKYEFFKNNISVQSGAGTTYSTSGLANGDVITVIGTSFGCPSLPSNAIATTVNAIPSVSLSTPQTTICAGDNITFTASPNTLSNYQFYKNGIAGQTGVGNTFSSTGIVNGDIVTVIGTQSGCMSPLSNGITIFVNPKPVVTLTASATTICQGDTITFTAVPGGYNNYQFFNSASSLQNGPGIVYTTSTLPPTSTITVIVTNLGCSSAPSNLISITVNPLPVVVISGTNVICTGKSSTLTASGASTYVWNTSQTINPLTVSPITSTTYSVKGTDTKGCSKTASYLVTVIQMAPVNAGKDAISCNGLGVLMNAGGGYISYLWKPSTGLSDPTSATPIANPLVTTKYTVIYKDVNGCIDSSNVTVTPANAAAYAGPDVTINYGTGNPLAGSGGPDYLWSPEIGLSCTQCQNPIANPVKNTTYTLTVKDSSGCIASDEVNVEVIVKNDIFVPDAFSPNGDSHNDLLFVRGNTIDELYFAVFDRWGTKVFEVEDKNVGWNGTYKGTNVEAGVYYYFVRAKIINGVFVTKKGDVTLVR